MRYTELRHHSNMTRFLTLNVFLTPFSCPEPIWRTRRSANSTFGAKFKLLPYYSYFFLPFNRKIHKAETLSQYDSLSDTKRIFHSLELPRNQHGGRDETTTPLLARNSNSFHITADLVASTSLECNLGAGLATGVIAEQRSKKYSRR